MSKSVNTLSIASLNDASALEGASHDVLLSATSQIVSAYIVNRPHEQLNLTQLTANVYATLAALARGEEVKTMGGVASTSTSGKPSRAPKVAIEESVKPDFIVCLEDGKRVKMLKRYLKTNFDMTPEEYRNRWNLPESYPMVAPNYAKVRSQLAKKIGLGTRGMPMAAKRLSMASGAGAR